MSKKEDILRSNKEIADKFGRIEKKLGEANDIQELFEYLFAGLESEFAIPFVWLTLAANDKTEPVIEAVKKSAALKNRLNIVPTDSLQNIIPAGGKPILANKDLRPFYKLFPPSNKYFIKSLAVIPLKIGNEIVGSWNNGDAVNDRYLPDMETDLVRKVADYVSSRLTEMLTPLQII